MLTLRVIPPRLIGRVAPRAPEDLAAFYFDALWRHWSVLDRATALALSATAMALNLRAARNGGAWRHGWDNAEQALVGGAGSFGGHLSMAARKGLHRLINPAAYPLDDNPLKNKRLFAARARAAGLPAPKSFDGPAEDLARWLADSQAIIVKPNASSKGAGVLGYRRAPGGWVSAGVPLGEAESLRAVAAAFAKGGVVQRAAPTHPGLEPISPGALPTLRVMTALDERGAVEACDRVVRFSAGGPRPVDNFNAGNFVAGLDEDNRVARAFRRVGAAVETAERHPATGVALSGWPIPDVERAVALAARAHEALAADFRLVGWDIGLCADGPVLIEGNWNPGTDILQLVSGRGLGETRLGALYRHHLERVPAEAWRAARPIELEPARALRKTGRGAVAAEPIRSFPGNHAKAHRLFSPPPCGEGSGVGVVQNKGQRSHGGAVAPFPAPPPTPTLPRKGGGSARRPDRTVERLPLQNPSSSCIQRAVSVDGTSSPQ